MPASAPQFTSLMSNELLARLEHLRLSAQRRLTERTAGEHVSRRGGQSLEFRDYRDYVDGDDIRFVDWNLFARLHRPYVKQFHEEEQMNLVVLVDGSSSMQAEGKFDRARQVAAAFGIAGLVGGEWVSAYCFRGPGAPTGLRKRSGRGGVRPLLRFLEDLEVGGTAPLEDGIDALLRTHRGRGVAVVLSDFLTVGDLRRPLNQLRSRGLLPWGVQILGPSEWDPELSTDLRLIDCETNAMLDVSAGDDLLDLYFEYRERFQATIKDQCVRRDGRFLALNSMDPLEQVISDQFRRSGWLA